MVYSPSQLCKLIQQYTLFHCIVLRVSYSNLAMLRLVDAAFWLYCMMLDQIEGLLFIERMPGDASWLVFLVNFAILKRAGHCVYWPEPNISCHLSHRVSLASGKSLVVLASIVILGFGSRRIHVRSLCLMTLGVVWLPPITTVQFVWPVTYIYTWSDTEDGSSMYLQNSATLPISRWCEGPKTS
jgi:hypothetical protein